MENKNWKKGLVWISVAAVAFLLMFTFHSDSLKSTTPIRNVVKNIVNGYSSSSLTIQERKYHGKKMVVLSNGIVQATFTNPGGDFDELSYNGLSNLFETRNRVNNRGYWDFAWTEITDKGGFNHYDSLNGKKFKVIRQDQEAIEISFTRSWNATPHPFGFNVDKRFIILKDHPGIYSYVLLEHPEEASASSISFIRAVFKLDGTRFNYMAISDDVRRKMPSPRERAKGQELAYPEAVRIVNSKNGFRGEVDDKYQYSVDNKDIKVHGWISSNPKVGFWVITPSKEFATAGPMKQELTSHVGPTCLSVFMSHHYVGKDLEMKFEKGEKWKKMYGPIAIYVNSISSNSNSNQDYHDVLWKRAKRQAKREATKWPFDFIKSDDYPLVAERGSVTGKLYVKDKYANDRSAKASFAYVGLAAPGEAGSWQLESKGYQFWVNADEEGIFNITNVRPGIYNLYAFVPGVIGNYVYEEKLTVQSGRRVHLGFIVFRPPRSGSTLWEIGYPDRTAAEYFIPKPLSTLTNPLYIHQHEHTYRQYGLWDRYTDFYPRKDIVFTVGESDYRRDWFYAHVNRKIGSKHYQSKVTWRVIFDLQNVVMNKNYTLQLALAAATGTDLQVRFNYLRMYEPLFRTHLIGRDNAIARHGIHGLYRLYSVGVPGYLLRSGVNTLYLTQSRSKGPFGGVMYDYLRFEAPPQ